MPPLRANRNPEGWRPPTAVTEITDPLPLSAQTGGLKVGSLRKCRSSQAGILRRMTEFTRILSAVEQGDPHAAAQLLPLVYDELRKLAAEKLAQERPGQTL